MGRWGEVEEGEWRDVQVLEQVNQRGLRRSRGRGEFEVRVKRGG